jgi:hypothetical protein
MSSIVQESSGLNCSNQISGSLFIDHDCDAQEMLLVLCMGDSHH